MFNNKLYVVALPIGNLQDITFRAIEVLKTVQCICAEDTRKFLKIKQQFHILTPVISYQDYNERTRSVELIKSLMSSSIYNVALVSDAGTPMVSDPGYQLISKCYENKIPVIPIPGVSSVTCALSVCPFNVSDFRFIGFFNKNKIDLIKNTNSTIVFFESPRRIQETLNILKNSFPERRVFIGREMTKTFEDFFYFSLKHIPPIPALGEFVVVLEPNDINIFQDFDLTHIKNKFSNINKADLVELLISLTKLPRKTVYTAIHK
jgi:16S rRNA (cytidine1402-2'-O)-methyltransferase